MLSKAPERPYVQPPPGHWLFLGVLLVLTDHSMSPWITCQGLLLNARQKQGILTKSCYSLQQTAPDIGNFDGSRNDMGLCRFIDTNAFFVLHDSSGGAT